LFLSTIVGPAFTIANFYINQEQIIEEYCENKAKPELNCEGNCHLTKELNKQINKVPSQERNELTVSLFLPNAFNEINSVIINHPKLKKNTISYHPNRYQYLGMDSFLHPPQI